MRQNLCVGCFNANLHYQQLSDGLLPNTSPDRWIILKIISEGFYQPVI